MEHKIENINRFLVAGITARIMSLGESGQADINTLWQKFMSADIFKQIPGKLADDVYSVYTAYQGNPLAYTIVLGCRVSTIDDLPDGLVGMEVAGGKFIVYQPEGRLPEIMANAWDEIWKADLDRSFVADFDIYSATSGASGEPLTKIYVGIK